MGKPISVQALDEAGKLLKELAEKARLLKKIQQILGLESPGEAVEAIHSLTEFLDHLSTTLKVEGWNKVPGIKAKIELLSQKVETLEQMQRDSIVCQRIRDLSLQLGMGWETLFDESLKGYFAKNMGPLSTECPNCKRPNKDEAKSCWFCKQVLVPKEADWLANLLKDKGQRPVDENPETITLRPRRGGLPSISSLEFPSLEESPAPTPQKSRSAPKMPSTTADASKGMVTCGNCGQKFRKERKKCPQCATEI